MLVLPAERLDRLTFDVRPDLAEVTAVFSILEQRERSSEDPVVTWAAALVPGIRLLLSDLLLLEPPGSMRTGDGWNYRNEPTFVIPAIVNWDAELGGVDVGNDRAPRPPSPGRSLDLTELLLPEDVHQSVLLTWSEVVTCFESACFLAAISLRPIVGDNPP